MEAIPQEVLDNPLFTKLFEAERLIGEVNHELKKTTLLYDKEARDVIQANAKASAFLTMAKNRLIHMLTLEKVERERGRRGSSTEQQ